MGSCGDDQRQPPRCGQFCSSGCTHCRHVTPCVGVADPGARHGRTSSLSCKASCEQPIPKSVAATPPVIPCVRTAEPWIRRRRTLPSSCHSVRADNRARASSRTHLSRRVPPPRVQTAHLRVHPRAPGALIHQAVTYDGDIPRGRVRVAPGGGIRRRRGQQSRPPTRRMPPAGRKCPRARNTSPAGRKCPRTRRMPPAGRERPQPAPGASD